VSNAERDRETKQLQTVQSIKTEQRLGTASQARSKSETARKTANRESQSMRADVNIRAPPFQTAAGTAECDARNSRFGYPGARRRREHFPGDRACQRAAIVGDNGPRAKRPNVADARAFYSHRSKGNMKVGPRDRNQAPTRSTFTRVSSTKNANGILEQRAEEPTTSNNEVRRPRHDSARRVGDGGGALLVPFDEGEYFLQKEGQRCSVSGGAAGDERQERGSQDREIDQYWTIGVDH